MVIGPILIEKKGNLKRAEKITTFVFYLSAGHFILSGRREWEVKYGEFKS